MMGHGQSALYKWMETVSAGEPIVGARADSDDIYTNSFLRGDPPTANFKFHPRKWRLAYHLQLTVSSHSRKSSPVACDLRYILYPQER